jgi:AcrR family transcriptional regulator
VKGNRAVATDDSSTPKGSLNEARWSEVIDAAFVVFSEESYESATIQDIAARVGLLKGSLYYYIESKEALLYAVIERSYVEALAWLQDDPALQDGDAPTRMTRFIERWLENVRLQTTGFVLAEREAHHLSREHRRLLGGYSSAIGAILRDIINQGQAEGVFDVSTKPNIAVTSIFRLLNGTAVWDRPSGRRSWTELVMFYQRFILRGLGYDAGAERRDNAWAGRGERLKPNGRS